MSLPPGMLIRKDPESKEQQGFDWTLYLAELDSAETIASSSWVVEEGDVSDAPATVLTVGTPTIVTGSKKTQVLLDGGTLGQTYRVVNSIVTSSGVEDDRSFFVLMEEK